MITFQADNNTSVRPMYGVSQKTPLQSFCDNLQTSTDLHNSFMLDSDMNCKRRWSKICHVASNVLPN